MRYLLVLALAFMATTAMADGVQSTATPVTIKIATLAPDGSAWMKHLRLAAAEVADQTQGRVVIKYFPGGVMGSDEVVMRKMKLGQLQGGVMTAQALAQLVPDANVYAQPFVFKTHQEAQAALERGRPVLEQAFQGRGMRLVSQAGLGFAYVMGVQPLDMGLTGRKVWMPSNDFIAEMILKDIGVSAVPLPLGDVFTSLQTGLVDTVATTPSGAVALQWHGKLRYAIDIPLVYVVGYVVIDEKAAAKIQNTDWGKVRGALGKAGAMIQQASQADDAKARLAMEKQGLVFRKPSPDDSQKWAGVGQRVRQVLRKSGTFSPGALQAVSETSAR